MLKVQTRFTNAYGLSISTDHTGVRKSLICLGARAWLAATEFWMAVEAFRADVAPRARGISATTLQGSFQISLQQAFFLKYTVHCISLSLRCCDIVNFIVILIQAELITNETR